MFFYLMAPFLLSLLGAFVAVYLFYVWSCFQAYHLLGMPVDKKALWEALRWPTLVYARMAHVYNRHVDMAAHIEQALSRAGTRGGQSTTSGVGGATNDPELDPRINGFYTSPKDKEDFN